MTEPFPQHPIYDQLLREQQQSQQPEPPADDTSEPEPTPETPSV